MDGQKFEEGGDVYCGEKISRRQLLRGVLGAAFAAAWTKRPQEAQAVQWKPEELCKMCYGKGFQTCSFCMGSGLFDLGDTVSSNTHVCPNCTGRGTITCPRCVGLGLRNVKGILRDGANEGTLKVRRDGTIEILKCEAFPSCSAV
eukprot:CAMPEP_0198723948 /NCGR_PEP_ID=MMETSP1475-20131203/1460_1 /TAXON_ID= ORGANISM="Unidentified sp., Strain CCMP1999" /NCGR_SAMPLE_ID=MMETSP1475 /ASSEMBLY_ACC=CAM_ASM_001111 /LENGTH=144 /DNA_ID=CAMNT_0044485291 /DNA_START=83 /DNA_END=518 /DNA_ORIENTATION=-